MQSLFTPSNIMSVKTLNVNMQWLLVVLRLMENTAMEAMVFGTQKHERGYHCDICYVILRKYVKKF